MKRYRLTKSGVCDCMLPDDNGPWVKYEDAEQAHREGWEQGKREAVKECHAHRSAYGLGVEYIADSIGRCIAAMKYGGEK